MALLQADHIKPISTSVTTSVFNKGSFATKSISVEESSSSSSPPPKPLLIVTPTTKGTYGVVLFLHGFFLHNNFYTELLNHIASHGYILVAPQKIEEAAEKGELTELVLFVIWNRLDLARRDIYEFPISGPQEIESAAEVTDWLQQGLKPLLPENVEPDLAKLALSGHSRGGKAAFALALGYAKTTLKFSVLLGIDPVAGATKWTRTEPHILTYVPESFDLPIPVAVIGTGLGPDQRNCLTPPCAPEGLNHEEFYSECKPPRAHFVAKDYGHMDMLDDSPPGVVGGLSGCICKNGAGPRDLMRRATGGVAVAFFRAYLCGDDSDLVAIVGDPSLAPTKLDPVEFVRA